MVACGFVLFKICKVALISFTLALLGLKMKLSIFDNVTPFYDSWSKFFTTTSTNFLDISSYTALAFA